MRPTLRILTVAAAVTTASVLTAVSISSLAGAHPATPASHSAAAARTLTLFAVQTGGGPVDIAPKGPSAGDEFFGHGKVTNSKGHQVGAFTLAIQLVQPKGTQ